MADWPSGLSDGQRLEPLGNAIANYGITVTAGTTPAKGSYVDLIAATPFDVAGVYLQVINNSSGSRYYVDIAVGNDPDEVVIIPNFYVAMPRLATSGASVYVPISVPRGKRIRARCSSNASSVTCAVNLILISAGMHHASSFGRVTAYGLDTANVAGTAMEPGGTANTKGAWVQLSGSTNRIRNLIIDCNNAANTALTSALWKVDVGIGSNPDEKIVVPDLILRSETTTDTLAQWVFGPFPVDIPAGSRLIARCCCSITDATDRVENIVVYGTD